MLPSASPLTSWLDAIDTRWPGARRRAASLGAAAALEVLLLLVLLSLGSRAGTDGPASEAITSFDVRDESRNANDTAPAPQQASKSPLQPAPSVPELVTPAPAPIPPAIVLPRPLTTPQPAPPAAPAPETSTTPPKITAVLRSDMAGVKGPQGAAGAPGDSQRIAGSSGPNGEPLYKAQWYREPTHDQLSGYLSYVQEDAWAVIDCRTVANFKVDDCVLVDEFPDRANMGRAVLAAAWQFLVRPPRIGGRVMVGEWVRIRISYDIRLG